jgi:protein SCO1/2
MSSRVRIAAVAAVAILAAIAGAWLSRALIQDQARVSLSHATLLDPPPPVPVFRLIDQDGAPFEQPGLLGRWHLLFFGFTNCPDVCPNTLTVLAAAERELSELAPSLRPRVLLVSVDPERDLPQQLAAYVHFFSPSFGAVTGSPAEIEMLARKLGVPVMRVALDEKSYTIDHGASIFLVDPQARLRALFSTPHDAKIIAADYRRIVER